MNSWPSWMSAAAGENDGEWAAMHDAEPSDETNFAMLLKQRFNGISDESLEHYIDLFLVDADSRLEVLRAALEVRDLKAVRRECHALKGTCLELGMKKLERCCDLLQEACREERIEALPGALDGLVREFGRIRPQIEAQITRSA